MLSSETIQTLNTFAPIRAVNGFIAVDFVWGCYQCQFCFNRNMFPLYPRGVPRDFALSPLEAARLIQSMPLFQVGTIIKIGHNSDQSLQPRAWELYEELPRHSNLAFYRRKPVDASEYQRFKQAYENVLLVMTLTPGSSLLGVDRKDAWEALESTRGLSHCFYAIRPIARDAVDEAYALMKALPPGSLVDLCGVISTFGGETVAYDSQNSPDRRTIAELRRCALSLGLQVNCSVNCILRGRQGLGSHWADKNLRSQEEDVRQFCRHCRSYPQCQQGTAGKNIQGLLEIARRTTGLDDLEVKELHPRKLVMCTGQAVNRGDQTYLRGLFQVRITLIAKNDSLSDMLNEEIYTRWSRTDFFPVHLIHRFAGRMKTQMGSSLL